MHSYNIIAKILLNINAIILNSKNFIEDTLNSPEFISTDLNLLASYPNESEFIADELIKHIKDTNTKADIIVAINIASIFLATQIARRLSLPMAYIRPSIKVHGRGKKIEGEFREGTKALVISDLMPPAKDMQAAIEILNEYKGSIVYLSTIFDDNITDTKRILEIEKISYYSLTERQAILKVASIGKDTPSYAIGHIAKQNIYNRNEEWNISQKSHIEEDNFDKISTKIAEIFLKIGTITIRPENPFKFSSGILSPMYTDNRVLISHQKDWEYVINSFQSLILNHIGVQNIDCIVGIATSGIPHAAYLVGKLNLPMAYVYPEVKDKNTYNNIKGRINCGDRILLIEDLISSGRSAISAVKILRDIGARVEWCLAIFTYNLPNSKEIFLDNNVKLLTLSDIWTLLTVGEAMGKIDLALRDIISEWIKDPKAYTQKINDGCKGA